MTEQAKPWPWPRGLWVLLATTIGILAILAFAGVGWPEWWGFIVLAIGLLLIVLGAWILGHFLHEKGVRTWRKK